MNKANKLSKFHFPQNNLLILFTHIRLKLKYSEYAKSGSRYSSSWIGNQSSRLYLRWNFSAIGSSWSCAWTQPF